MALEPHHKAVMALGLTAVCHLDADCCTDEDPGIHSKRQAARGILHKGVQGAAHHVKSVQDLAAYLNNTARELEHTVGLDHEDLIAAHNRLTAMAIGVRDDEGEGIAHPPSESDGCACGILELAGLVEQRVRDEIGAADVGLESNNPVVRYATHLIDRHELLTTFRVVGQAKIGVSPRVVHVLLKLDQSFTARDMVHLAYTLHHELVCHAFQGALADSPRDDAHHSCHWTEGWMDTLAYDLTTAWIEGETRPPEWIALGGEAALGEVRKFHDDRYFQPPYMTDRDIDRRRLARDAYRAFVGALERAAIARSPDDAKRLGQKFSLLLNTHADANCKRLKLLSTMLLNLVTRDRLELAIKVAQAGFAFVYDRDLCRLEQTVAEAVHT